MWAFEFHSIPPREVAAYFTRYTNAEAFALGFYVQSIISHGSLGCILGDEVSALPGDLNSPRCVSQNAQTEAQSLYAPLLNQPIHNVLLTCSPSLTQMLLQLWYSLGHLEHFY